eukprot:CAMPEP_0184310890 /NCGR_PEP_ID=MMETSP1049-20130417/35775_1 /TAXON_ID=77928 /ORGANISM="Proteomonas sulcata, Strain CCMP704" /LENGTH=112 /DNA_ID=CAMNT_0026625667 /DNA_START=8 /DNA_END=346 /DNA_ORIENTATION=-
MVWKAGLSVGLRELRFRLNPRSPQAAGLTAFIENNYKFLKALNPNLKFLVREYPDADFEPVVEADLPGPGAKELATGVSNMSEAQILELIKGYADKGHALGIETRSNLKDIV